MSKQKNYTFFCPKRKCIVKKFVWLSEKTTTFDYTALIYKAILLYEHFKLLKYIKCSFAWVVKLSQIKQTKSFSSIVCWDIVSFFCSNMFKHNIYSAVETWAMSSDTEAWLRIQTFPQQSQNVKIFSSHLFLMRNRKSLDRFTSEWNLEEKFVDFLSFFSFQL